MLWRRVLFIPRRRRKRRGPARSPEYLRWIRTLPCLVCGQKPDSFHQIEAAHTNALGPGGLSQKSSDYSAIPLCAVDHRTGPESYHCLTEREFSRVHALDLPQLVSALNKAYERRLLAAQGAVS